MIVGSKCCKPCVTIGELPTSFIDSMSYYECIVCLTKKMDEIIKAFNNIIDGKISEYIDLRFNDMMLDALYEAPTETLVLYLRHDSDANVS